MDGQIAEPGAQADSTVGDESGGSSKWRRAWRRASSLLKLSRGADPTERLTEFLSQEAKDGDGRSREQRALLMNVARLSDLRVDDVMVPRADIIAIDVASTLEETLDAFRNSSHSRLPVYRETLDDPVGVIHLKDLALSHGFGGDASDFALSSHVRDVQVVPPSMRAQALLQRMQATRRHMALVIDEYGGVDGLVTIEDLIEVIVGDIEDEHDDAERPLWRRQPDGAFLAEARATIADFAEETGIDLRPADWDDDVDTLGGLVFTLCGRVPERGEVIRHPSGYEFDIVDADPRRVKRLRIRASTETTKPEAEPPLLTADVGDDAADDAQPSVAELPRAEGDALASPESGDTVRPALSLVKKAS